ncbi:phosphoglycolate phosphatase [Methanonatronarchaeum sp. AMET6-2]|uniref:phosphoglycolate phosphatase n=1 Tax=Methanonatronarchaeum sp. AMET6-2 TaxID=2933293 RepID=UPI001205A701|nr:phosphoglycolate phosphatase [Methanonatronarchaeum sp. AMET6-2]RZN62750.1 MAG: phosphoglycolate phosphatase [Methanonatronarchaeia archaeon]UOY10346.1 phosphoglycolate phosphatase [Methanonatronarchaeum sp. AMET6-2]
MIKALAIDIDGTITDSQRRLSLKATKAIRSAIKNNIKVILATGNKVCFARSTAILIGTNSPIIAENGGVINYGEHNKILADKKKIQEAYNYLKTQAEIDEFNDNRHTEIAFGHTNPEQIKEILKNHEVDVVDTKFAVHIKNKGINKGNALKKLARELDIPIEQTAAIGDSDNDIEMINQAGTGIALKNATPKLTENADIKIDRENGEGVVKAIRQLGIINKNQKTENH